jgi:hypothetical protein
MSHIAICHIWETDSGAESPSTASGRLGFLYSNGPPQDARLPVPEPSILSFFFKIEWNDKFTRPAHHIFLKPDNNLNALFDIESWNLKT